MRVALAIYCGMVALFLFAVSLRAELLHEDHSRVRSSAPMIHRTEVSSMNSRR